MENNEENFNRTTINRMLTMYDNMLESSVQSYVQLNNNIRTLESGLREILEYQIHYSRNSNTNRSRNFNNNEHINPRNSLPESLIREMSNYNNSINNRPSNNRPLNNRPLNNRTNFGPLNNSYRSYTRPSNRTTPTTGSSTQTRLTELDANSNDLLRAFFPNTFTNEDFNNLTPVVVRPSASQIERVSETIPLSIANSSNDNMCPITQREFIESDIIIRLRGCGHCFLQQAINSWFTRSVLCPVCRYDIRNYTPINDISNNQQDDVQDDDDNDVQEDDDVQDDDDIDVQEDDDVQDESSEEQSSATTSESPAMNELINVISSQLSQTLNNQLSSVSDLSLNDLDNRGLNLEYSFETPAGGFTISSASASSIGEMLRNFNQPPNRQQ